MADIHQFTCPVMGAGTGFHGDQTRSQIGEENANLSAPQGLPDDRFVALIYPVNLKYILRQIDPDTSQCHVQSPKVW